MNDLAKKIYFDHNATTPLRKEALEAMLPYLDESTGFYGNPSSVYMLGQKTRAAVESARAVIASAIGASPEEIIFTSCGSESDTFAIKGALSMLLERTGHRHIVSTKIEHDCVLYCLEAMQAQGWEVTLVSPDKNGCATIEEVRAALRPDTVFLSMMHVNNETGVIQPVAKVAELCRERDILFHTDAIQSVGKIPVNVDSLNVDLLSLSAHKFYGPKGVAALYVRKGTRMAPLLHGHQEKNRRAGTENVAGIVGMAKALELALEEMPQESQRIYALRHRLETELLKVLPLVQINGKDAERIAGTANLSFDCVEGEGAVVMLDLEGISVSTGSACASGTTKPSHVLRAMGISEHLAQAALRFSLGRLTGEAEVARALEVVPKVITRLREMSPIWPDRLAGKVTEIHAPTTKSDCDPRRNFPV